MNKNIIETFTPRHSRTGERIVISISTADYEKIQNAERGDHGYKWTKVFDLTNKRFITTRRARCGADCFCDAMYKEIT